MCEVLALSSGTAKIFKRGESENRKEIYLALILKGDVDPRLFQKGHRATGENCINEESCQGWLNGRTGRHRY